MTDMMATTESTAFTTPMQQDLTDFHVEVQPVTKIEKHPNADTLSIGECCGAPVIFVTGEYLEGDLAAYIPIDAIVPADDPRWAHLKGHWRIRAKKLRGIFSQGMLTKPDPTWPVGFDARAALRIEKYEPASNQVTLMNTESEKNPGYLPHYGIESYRRHKDAIAVGEEVVCSEKVHGAQGSAIFRDGRLYVASHYHYKVENPDNLWWKAALKYDLATKLATVDGIGIFYEVYGQVQDLKYGAKPGELFIRVFDAYDSHAKVNQVPSWFNYEDLVTLCKRIDLPMVPTLYRGPWDSEKLLPMANGASTIPGANCIREGFVVKPVVEREIRGLGRVILKVVGETYLLRKNG